jgi:hypothetical protein
VAIIQLLLYVLGLLLSIGIAWVVFVTLRQMRAESAIERGLMAVGLKPRQIYAESLILIKDHLAVTNAKSDTRGGKTEDSLSEDSFAALFFHVNPPGPDGQSGSTLDGFLREHLKPLTAMQLRRIELFVASSELPEAEFQKVRRLMISRQREAADKIRSSWQGQLGGRMAAKAQTARDRDEISRQKLQWSKDRTSPASGAALTDWLRAQGPDMWHEVCLNIEWAEKGANDLVPFVEWLVEQPQLDQSSALVLLGKAVCDGVDTEAYEQHDCARNSSWMKIVHDRLMNDLYSPMQWIIPPAVRPDVEALFVPETVGAWAVPRMELNLAPAKAHRPQYAFIGNRPVEGFAAWKARRFA